MNILARTFDELCSEITIRYGKGRYHAAALYREVMKNGSRNISAVSEFAAQPKLASQIMSDIFFPDSHVTDICAEEAIKFAVTLHDGNVIESVIIPVRNRITLCVSSQVGCKMGCVFCMTASGGFIRNLMPEEIVYQVFAARFELGYAVDTIVFMGMGEPLDNVINVVQAIRVLSDQRGFNIALSDITVSTAGHIDGLRILASYNMKKLRLALSINAPTSALRSQLMPINKRYPLEKLISFLATYPLCRGGIFFVEYVLLAGVNDSDTMADKLAECLQGLPVRINLIVYNKNDTLNFQPPSPEQVERFRSRLVAHKLFVRIRKSAGENIQAACGQLRAALLVQP
jgi:23S rRNA (adenine2503-C2)-methyltransferase